MSLGKIPVKLFCLLLISTTMHSQQNFGTYVNGLFFSIFSDKPDSQVTAFLSQHVPILLHPPEAGGSWTAYPNNVFPKFNEVPHSYFFSTHPFLKTSIKQGELKIYTLVFADSVHSGGVDIRNVEVLLKFGNPNDAIELFERIKSNLVAFGADGTFYEEPLKKTAVFYSRETNYRVPAKIRARLLNGGKHDDDAYQLIIDVNGD